MPEAKLPELKDRPRCNGGMKLSERPFFLPFACVKDGAFHAADDGWVIYVYLCMRFALSNNQVLRRLRRKARTRR